MGEGIMHELGRLLRKEHSLPVSSQISIPTENREFWGKLEFSNLRLSDFSPEWWQGRKVLDAGANLQTTLAKRLEREGANTVSLSLDWAGAPKAAGENRVEADFVTLPLPDESIDLVVASKSTPLYAESDKVFRTHIKEFLRVVKPGGEIRITPCLLSRFNIYHGVSGVKNPGLCIAKAAEEMDIAIVVGEPDTDKKPSLLVIKKLGVGFRHSELGPIKQGLITRMIEAIKKR